VDNHLGAWRAQCTRNSLR